MPDIKILVRNKRATVEGTPVIICGNSDYTVTFDFDGEWSAEGFKTARFVYIRDGEPQHEDVVFKGATAAVPILSGVLFVKVGVFAGKLSTTTPARILCDRSILCGTDMPPAPTSDVYSQLMEMVDEYYNALLEKTDAFIEEQTNLMQAYQEHWDSEVEQSIIDARNAGQQCMDAVSALQVEFYDMNGGDPFTEESSYEHDVNGGYPA